MRMLELECHLASRMRLQGLSVVRWVCEGMERVLFVSTF